MAALLAIFFFLVATLTVGLFIGHVWWMPELISSHGAAVDHELVLTLIIAGVAFFLAQVALGYFIWRFRGKDDGKPASNWHENRKLEIFWTVVTAIVFVGLAIRGNGVWADYILSDVPSNAVTIEVTAQQFAWNFRYPGPDGQFGRAIPSLINDSTGNFLGIDPSDPAGKDDITTQNIVAVPVNRPVQVILRTKDVTHSFFVPVMRVKQDAVPGMAIRVHFTAEKTGEYEVACAELCGMQHYKMRARFLVMQENEFQDWLKQRASQ
jgi:cytochrome c oxidase subunit II